MDRILYTGLIRIYNVILYFSSFFNDKAEKIINGRKETLVKIKEKRKPGDKVIWIHCASLGEFEQARPLLEALPARFQDFRIFISFFSSSGYEIHKDYSLAECVFYLPQDTKIKAERLVQMLNPTLVIFIKYEFWYNFLKTCNERRIPVLSVSTIIRPDHFVFSVWGGFYRKIFKLFSFYYVQNNETRELLERIGIKDIEITGDTRVDRVNQICSDPVQIQEIKDFGRGVRLFILGSTWKPDIDLWAPYINQTSHNIRFVIAPHHINEDELIYIERKFGNKTVRFSKSETKGSNEEKVMIVDNIGKLSSIYSYGYISYVGGAFSEGLHNILEPAAYGLPVLIGKHKSNRKYQEALDLTEEGGVFEIADSADLKERVEILLANKKEYDQAAKISRNYIDRNLGATEKILNSIKTYLE